MRRPILINAARKARRRSCSAAWGPSKRSASFSSSSRLKELSRPASITSSRVVQSLATGARVVVPHQTALASQNRRGSLDEISSKCVRRNRHSYRLQSFAAGATASQKREGHLSRRLDRSEQERKDGCLRESQSAH